MAKNAPIVFISYVPEDKNVADFVQRFLEIQGLRVWADREIKPEGRWAAEIEQSLREAAAYVFIITPKSLASNWVQFEMGAALSRSGSSRGVPIVPVVLGGAEAKDLPPLLRQSAPIVDANTMDFNQVCMHLRERLKELFQEEQNAGKMQESV